MRFTLLKQWIPDDIVNAVGWTLIHSLWQGLLAAVLAGIIIISTKRATARLRYNLLGGVFVLFTITAIITLCVQFASRTAHIQSVGVRNQAVIALPVVITDIDIAHEPAVTTVERFVNYFNSNAGFIVLIWAIFFLVHCIKLAGGLAGVQRIRSYRTHTAPDEWIKKLEHLCRTIGINQTVGLLQSELIKVPIAIGFLKPVILLPLGLLSNLPPGQIETILIHELAHVRRKDYFVNILQRMVEAVFFFNPGLLWIASLIRQEREACCDDVVIANANYKGNYLEALVSFQEYSLARSGYAMAISTRRNYLLNRVKRMITNENKKLNFMEKTVLVAGLLAFTAFSFIPKKENISRQKQEATAINIIHTRSNSAPVRALSLSLTERPARHIASHANVPVVQLNSEPKLEVFITTPPVDTVPAKGKNKTEYDQLSFPSVSSSVNDDGKGKIEIISVTDQNGKKYGYTKENDKLTKLTIAGNNIPESDFGNYSGLLVKIQMTLDYNKDKRREAEIWRKQQRNIQLQASQNLVSEKKLMLKLENAQRQEMRKEGRLFNGSRNQLLKSTPNEKLQLNMLMRKLRTEQLKPTLHGREIIKVENNLEKIQREKLALDTRINAENKLELANSENYAGDLKKSLIKPASMNLKSDHLINRNLELKTKPVHSIRGREVI